MTFLQLRAQRTAHEALHDSSSRGRSTFPGEITRMKELLERHARGDSFELKQINGGRTSCQRPVLWEVPAFFAGCPRVQHNFELAVRLGPSVLKEPAALHVNNNFVIFSTERNA